MMGWVEKVTYTHCGHIAYINYVQCQYCPPNMPPAYCPLWQVLPIDRAGICRADCLGPGAPVSYTSPFASRREASSNFKRPLLIGNHFFDPRGQMANTLNLRSTGGSQPQKFTTTCGSYVTNVFSDPNGDVTMVTETDSYRYAVLTATPGPA